MKSHQQQNGSHCLSEQVNEAEFKVAAKHSLRHSGGWPQINKL